MKKILTDFKNLSKKNKVILICDIVLFLILFAVYIGWTGYLFYHQTAGNGGFGSDMDAYLMEIKGEESGYDFPYPVMFLAARFFAHFSTPVIGLTIAVTLLNGLTPIALKYIFNTKFNIMEKPYKGIVSSVATFLLLIVSMLYPFSYLGHYNEIGPDFLYRYQGSFSPNPYHNATSLCSRPFALMAFYYFVEIVDKYEEKNKWFCKEYLLFGFFLFTATMTKPSFTLVMGLCALVLMLVNLVKSGFKTIKQFFQFGIYYIPTVIALLFQYRGAFAGGDPGSESGVGFAFMKAWSVLTDNVFLSILFGMAFPIVVVIFHVHKLKKEKFLFYSFVYYLFGLFTLMFLYEKGWRCIHVNFAWGYIIGMFLMYVASLYTLLKDTFEKETKYPFLIIQYAVFTLHIIFGIDYLTILLSGKSFS